MEGILRESLIVLDTNVLLDLYRATPAARAEMLQAIEAAKGNLWVPHQVALEFHRNRIGAAKDQRDFYAVTRRDIEGLKEQTLQKIGQFANRCALGKEVKGEMQGEMAAVFENLIERIEAHRNDFEIKIPEVVSQDPILDRLSLLLDGKVGAPFSEEQMEEARKEGERRRSQSIPPGYKDAGKSDNPLGDYFLWEQTLIEAKSRDIDVLLISNDEKEDWVEKRLNFALGPRVELVEEMRSRAGVELNIMTFPAFLEAAKKYLQTSVSVQTIDQARRALAREQENNSERLAGVTIQEEMAPRIRQALVEFWERLGMLDTSYANDLARLQGDGSTNPLLIESTEKARRGNQYMMEKASDAVVEFDEALARAVPTKQGIYMELSRNLASDVLRKEMEFKE
ncbi:PIN domain-containing protein [Streptomyces sp. NPDC056683]|uniref:PIN domain-containing protein n=1 Tax=Streptomyces sp. NPDC056683 TaxID=3345910 RepID=UPI0036C15F87